MEEKKYVQQYIAERGRVMVGERVREWVRREGKSR